MCCYVQQLVVNFVCWQFGQVQLSFFGENSCLLLLGGRLVELRQTAEVIFCGFVT